MRDQGGVAGKPKWLGRYAARVLKHISRGQEGAQHLRLSLIPESEAEKRAPQQYARRSRGHRPITPEAEVKDRFL